MSDDNPLALVLAPHKCKRIKRNGEQCGNWPRRGQTVCGFHGGSAPQNIRAARRRLNELAWTAVEALEWAINEARRTSDLNPLINACRTVLDRVPGFGAKATLDMHVSAGADEWAQFVPSDRLAVMAAWINEAKAAMVANQGAAVDATDYDNAIDVDVKLLEARDAKV